MLFRRLRNLAARCLLGGLCAAPLRAFADEGDTLALPAAGVQSRIPENDPGRVSRLDAESLRRFASLEEALNALPGFQVRQAGGLGGYSELSFRGADAGYVEIFLDGLRLNQEGDAAPDLAKFPLLWFTGLEARTGFDGFGAGDPGSLARVDLSTETKNQRVGFANRISSFSTDEAAATVHGGQAWKWTLGVEGQSSRNDYPFFNDRGAIYNTADDTLMRMQNNAYTSRGAHAALRHEGTTNTQSLSLLFLDYTKEYPGLPSDQTPSATAQAYTLHHEFIGGWRGTTFLGPAMAEAGVQARRFDDDYRDPEKTLGYLSYEAARTSTALECDARLRAPLHAKLEGTAEILGRGETVQPTAQPFDQTFASPAAERRELQLGISLHLQWTRTLSVTGEARGAAVFFNAQRALAFPSLDSAAPASASNAPLAFRLGGQWKTPLGDWGALGRFEQRAPSASELLGDNNGIRVDLGLRPEQTQSVEILHAWQRDSVRVQTSAFWNHYLDPIRLEAYGASAFLHYANGSDYRAYGLEVEGQVHAKRWEGDAAFTWQNLAVLGGGAEGNWPAYQSPFASHAALLWKPAAAITAGPVLDFRGPYYPGDVNLAGTHRAAEMIWGAETAAMQGPLRLAFDARNLTDHHTRDFAYSVQSGRSYALSLSINL